MKPDWKDAPEWATWFGSDHVGFAYFNHKPTWDDRYGWQCREIQGALCTGEQGEFEKNLERRP